MQKEINAQTIITQRFGQEASKAVGDYAQTKTNQAKDLRTEASQAEQAGDKDRAAQLIAQATELENLWGDQGSLRIAAHTLIGGLTGGTQGALGAAAGTLAAPEIAKALIEAGLDPDLTKVLTAIATTTVGTAVGGTAGAGAALNEVANNYLTHSKVLAVKNCLSGRTCTSQEQKEKMLTDAENLSKLLDDEMNQICQKAPTSDACRTAVNAATQYTAMQDAWAFMNGDVSRSANNVFDYIYNADGAQDRFVLYYNTIDNRADFFGASNLYEQNTGSGAKWFGGAEFVSRAPVTGLGADGSASWITFALGSLLPGAQYEWRSTAGNALMQTGFESFKGLYNKGTNNPAAWDINQLRNEQMTLQPIHGACKNFCVNGHPAGNCHIARSDDDRRKESSKYPMSYWTACWLTTASRKT